jgi:thioredoxin-like negative regulator of GroEL
VFFFSSTSGRARRVEGYLAQVLQRRGNHETFRIVRVDSNSRPDLLERFHVTEAPTLLVIEHGRVCARLAQPTGCAQITRLLSPWLR